MALCPGLPGWAGTSKAKPSWILLKQETVSGSGIGWAICKSAPRSRQITTPAPHHSVFYRPGALPAAQPTVSKHWRHLQARLVQTKYSVTKILKWKIQQYNKNSPAPDCSEILGLINVRVLLAFACLRFVFACSCCYFSTFSPCDGIQINDWLVDWLNITQCTNDFKH